MLRVINLLYIFYSRRDLQESLVSVSSRTDNNWTVRPRGLSSHIRCHEGRIHEGKHRHTRTHARTHAQTYIHTYMHACMHACMHTYIHTYKHTHMHTQCTNMHTYILDANTNIYLYMYTHYVCFYCKFSSTSIDVKCRPMGLWKF